MKPCEKRLRILNIDGVVLVEYLFAEGMQEAELFAPALADGMYIVEIITEKQVVSGIRWVVKH